MTVTVQHSDTFKCHVIQIKWYSDQKHQANFIIYSINVIEPTQTTKHTDATSSIIRFNIKH
jgi:hypothetical protein